MKKTVLTRILSITAALTVSMSFLTGCAKKTTETSTDKQQGTTQLSQDTPGWKEDTSPITFDWYVNLSWFGAKWGQDVTSKYITEKTGVSINYSTPAGNEVEKVNTMIASGKLPDIISLGWYEDGAKKLVEGKLVEPLNELAKKYDPYFFKVSNDQVVGWYTQKDGNLYGYPNYSYSPSDISKSKDLTSNQTFLVKKDMYEALGKPDMSTPEGFLDALKAAKEKFPNVNGQPLIPFGVHEFTETGNGSLEDYLQNFLAIPKEKDGKLYDRNTDPEYLKWLKTFRKANEMGLISKDIFTDKRAQMEEKAGQGRYFSMLYQWIDLAAPQIALHTQDPNSVYIAVNGPANSNHDQPKLSGPGISGWMMTFISKTCKDPKRAMRFIDYLISDEGQHDIYLGKKGETYDVIDGKEQLLPEVQKLKDKDGLAQDLKYGAATHLLLSNEFVQRQWYAPMIEPLKQTAEWTHGKVVSYSQYDNMDPLSDSDEGIIQKQIADMWGIVLPKLILAKSEVEFDKVWNDFQDKKKQLGYDKLVKYQQGRLEENKAKLGIK